MKLIKRITLFIGIILFIGCEKPLDYKFQDKPQKVECPGIDKSLMHEALYSFQEDLGAQYNDYTDYKKGGTQYYMEGYAQFVFFGFSGTAPYQKMVSPHSLDILKELQNERDLWTSKNGKIALNYSSDYVSCLLTSIANEELREKLNSLKEVDYLTPQIIAETMRINVIEVVQDPYLAMYMALDAYYQPLMNIEFTTK